MCYNFEMGESSMPQLKRSHTVQKATCIQNANHQHRGGCLPNDDDDDHNDEEEEEEDDSDERNMGQQAH